MAEFQQPDLLGFGIANYRSFDETGFIIDNLQKITVFIGKNNSGKSNALRAVRLLKRITSPKMPQGSAGNRWGGGLGLTPEVDSHNRHGAPPTAIVLLAPESLSKKDAMRRRLRQAQPLSIRWNTGTGDVSIAQNFDDWTDRDLLALRDELTDSYYSHTPERKKVLSDLCTPLGRRAVEALRIFDHLICVEDFREIRRVESDVESDVSSSEVFNGHNVISSLRVMQNPKIGQEDKRRTFDRIQQFVRGLLAELDLLMEVPTEEDAIYVSMHQKRLPLTSYGTGVHQLVILSAALAIHESHVVCIEEPEIHRHPELQRKFIQFIAEQTSNRYLITTHSSVFLDFRPDVNIYHVTNDRTRSMVMHVDATPRARMVLADLGYKASDLLQANCVVWVEGPSDRVYLKKRLELFAPDVIEGIHYAVAFYGGKTLAHFTGCDEPEDDLVEVLRINQHAIFVMDRDDLRPDGALTHTKARIQAEMDKNGDGWCWATDGREIENYLRPELINSYLSKRVGECVQVASSRDGRLGGAIAAATKGMDGPRVHYAKENVACARGMIELMDAADLDVFDLRACLGEVVALIRKWNGESPSTAPASTA